jgi:hypothetical protein
MTAREFFDANTRDGRALLSPDPPAGFARFGGPGPGRPSTTQVTEWLIQVGGRLILCDDSIYPAQRFVADAEDIMVDSIGRAQVGTRFAVDE